MPSLGADMEAGTLVEWMVKPGDQVKRGDIVAVVETQKGAIEIEIFDTGTIDKILVDIGTKVPVGTPLARLRTKPKRKPARRNRQRRLRRHPRRLLCRRPAPKPAPAAEFKPAAETASRIRAIAGGAPARSRAWARSRHDSRQRRRWGNRFKRCRSAARVAREAHAEETCDRIGSRRHAHCDRRGHGAIEAGNSPLLSPASMSISPPARLGSPRRMRRVSRTIASFSAL